MTNKILAFALLVSLISLVGADMISVNYGGSEDISVSESKINDLHFNIIETGVIASTDGAGGRGITAGVIGTKEGKSSLLPFYMIFGFVLLVVMSFYVYNSKRRKREEIEAAEAAILADEDDEKHKK